MTNSFRAIMFTLFLLMILGTTSYAIAQEQRVLLLPKTVFSTNGRGIEIVEPRIAGKAVELEKPFIAEDTWVRDLTFKVKNISGKPIRFISITFSLLDTRIDGKDGVVFRMIHGKGCKPKSNSPCDVKNDDLRLITPGEEVEMGFRFGKYMNTKNLAIERTGVSKFNQVAIGMAVIQFEDGTFTMSQDLASRSINTVNR